MNRTVTLFIGIEDLLLRYGTSQEGRVVKKAHIFIQEEHGIDPRFVDADAVWIVRQLRKAGYHGYVVGGAVRDLLIGRRPNDFDVATDALPQKIKRIFRSARIIGRRFRIVHVYIGREKFIEVTTFRSNTGTESNNLFGTMEEDAQRRDFTINALYYCPLERQVIDYVGGFSDIRQKKLKTLIPAEASFSEDPVRMIRAVKYAVLTGFPVPLGMAGLIKRMRQSILQCSRERVTEEVYKILTTGESAEILDLSFRLRLFEVIFPTLAEHFRESHRKISKTLLYRRTGALDVETRAGRGLARDRMFEFLFRDLVFERTDMFHDTDPGFLIQQFLRSVSQPLFPSKKDLALAVHSLYREFWQAGRGSARVALPSSGRSPMKHRGTTP
jgi:poly(A) polymerase